MERDRERVGGKKKKIKDELSQLIYFYLIQMRI